MGLPSLCLWNYGLWSWTYAVGKWICQIWWTVMHPTWQVWSTYWMGLTSTASMQLSPISCTCLNRTRTRQPQLLLVLHLSNWRLQAVSSFVHHFLQSSVRFKILLHSWSSSSGGDLGDPFYQGRYAMFIQKKRLCSKEEYCCAGMYRFSTVQKGVNQYPTCTKFD